jgi:hypothetical protein
MTNTNEMQKAEYRRYLEKTNSIDILTKAMLSLFDEEEQQRQEDPRSYILKQLGGPTQAEFDEVRIENERLRKEVTELRRRVADMPQIAAVMSPVSPAPKK